MINRPKARLGANTTANIAAEEGDYTAIKTNSAITLLIF